MPRLNWLDSKVRQGLNPKVGAPWWCDRVVSRKKVVWEGDIWFVVTYSMAGKTGVLANFENINIAMPQ